jgi:hypothetical protein
MDHDSSVSTVMVDPLSESTRGGCVTFETSFSCREHVATGIGDNGMASGRAPDSREAVPVDAPTSEGDAVAADVADLGPATTADPGTGIPERYRLQSLSQTLDVLEFIGDNGPAAGVTQIATALALTKGAVHRILLNLVARGWAGKTEDSRYTLGPRLWALGIKAADQYQMSAVAEPVMRELVEMTHETSLLAVGVAAPVRDFTGGVVAAIGVSGPAYRIDEARRQQIASHVRRAADRLSSLLGYRPGSCVG